MMRQALKICFAQAAIKLYDFMVLEDWHELLGQVEELQAQFVLLDGDGVPTTPFPSPEAWPGSWELPVFFLGGGEDVAAVGQRVPKPLNPQALLRQVREQLATN